MKCLKRITDGIHNSLVAAHVFPKLKLRITSVTARLHVAADLIGEHSEEVCGLLEVTKEDLE